MAMAHMYEVNEKVDSLQRMINASANHCGIQPPTDNEELWQLKLPKNLSPEQASSWYKMINLVKKRRRLIERANELDSLLPCYSLELPEEKLEEIQRILNNVSMDMPPHVSRIRSGKNYEFQGVLEKYKHIEDSEFKKRFLQSVTGTLEEKIMHNKHYNLSYKRDSRLDYDYETEWNKKIRNSRYLGMLEYRRNLPAYYKVEELIRMVSEQQVIIISGETGCGKTTQIPQFILDYELKSGRGSICHIICTQPRRISAISIAERVAQERAEKLGESVGYQIRLEKVKPRKTGSILFCTTGTLLQMMQNDPVLRDVSHVILDEIHERNTMSDFILAILKDIIQLRKDLKVILMSATLNAERFSEYFNNCHIINIPGRAYPVKEYYLEDVLEMTGFRFKNLNSQANSGKSQVEEAERMRYREELLIPYTRNPQSLRMYSAEVLDCLLSPDAEILNLDLIFEIVCFICDHEPPGAILVFLPGWDRILKLLNKIEKSGKFPKNKFVVVPLHSMLSTIGQKSVFSTPPEGVRKIVIATNIAETSITIDDIIYVVDSGLEKLSDFDTTDNIYTLEERWVSQANAKQRKGRVGRVQAGICYKLYSRPKEMSFSQFQLPEILRTRLEEVILQTKVLQLGHTESFLAKVMDPPSHDAVRLSLELLQGMNALDDEECLTPLGFHLAHLPIDPMAGKMMLLGALFGCLDPISSIACALSFKDYFTPPPGQVEVVDTIKLNISENTRSDHILLAKVFEKWREAKSWNRAKEFTHNNFLNNCSLYMARDLKKQLTRHLCDMGFLKSISVEDEMANYNSDNIPLLRSIVCAGLFPNIAIVSKVKPREQKNRFTIMMSTLEDQHVQLHQRSINSMVEGFESAFFAYFTKMRSTQVYLHDTTMVYPMALIFFCHNFHIEEVSDKKVIALNKRLRFSCKPNTANLVQELRAWLDWLIDYKVAHPCSIDWTQNNDENFILKAIIGLLSLEIKVKDPEILEKKPNQPQQSYSNFCQFGNLFTPSSQLLTLDQSLNIDRPQELPWIKELSTEKSIIPDMDGSDMSSMSGEEGLLANYPPKKKKKKIKKIKMEMDVKKEDRIEELDERPWIRSLILPLRDKELQVAVIIRDLQPMSYEEANIVKRALITDVGLALRGIGLANNGIIQPRFTESNLVPPGVLLVSCLDEVTRDWMLRWKPPKLQFSPNRFLQVVKGNSLVWPEKLQVAVVLKDFMPMTSKDADNVRSGLVADVSLVLGEGLSIQFTNLEFIEPGWLLITCLDRNSRDWVLKWNPPRVRTLQPYIVSADSLPWPVRIGFSLPSEQKPEWDSICYYIRHQNSSIEVDSWKFLDATINADGTWLLSLSVPPSSILALDKIGWRLFYQIDYLTVIQLGKMPLFSAMPIIPITSYPNQYQPNQEFQPPPNIFNYFVHH